MIHPSRIASIAAIFGLTFTLTLACNDDENPSPSGTPADGEPWPPPTFGPGFGSFDSAWLREEENGARVEVGLGGNLIIELESNPSTGFAWRLVGPVPARLAMRSGYVPPPTPLAGPPVVGAPGTDIFAFKATAKGTACVELEYRREFETDVPPERTFRACAMIREH